MLPKKIKNHSSSFLVSSKVARFVGSAASASKAKKKAKSVSAIARSVLSDDVPTRSVAPVFCSPPLGFSAKFGSVPDIPAPLGALIAAPATESAAPAMESPALVVNSTVKAGSSSPRSDVATAGDEEGFSTPASKKTSHLGGSNMHPQAVTASVHVGNCSNSFDVLSDDQVVDDPFFLVNNRKSGRKATKN
ncbi:BnaC01g20300D [Brassica napus]|uniref:BnaC01g20300D protein n=1 Tax=Brassica napus TaxID=3708 RepID=A0A078G327_BRANA|nr:BnaC01g20300D [Brassica napus]